MKNFRDNTKEGCDKEETQKRNNYEAAFQSQIREQDEQIAQLNEKLEQPDHHSSISLNSISSQTNCDVDRYYILSIFILLL